MSLMHPRWDPGRYSSDRCALGISIRRRTDLWNHPILSPLTVHLVSTARNLCTFRPRECSIVSWDWYVAGSNQLPCAASPLYLFLISFFQ